MAIVEMSSVIMVGPGSEREAALRAVGEAGVVDLRMDESTREPEDLAKARRRVARVLEELGEASGPSTPGRPEPEPEPGEAMAAVVDAIEARLRSRDELVARRRELRAERDHAREWGGVDADQLCRLADAGVHLVRAVVPGRALSSLPLAPLPWSRTRSLPRRRVEVVAIGYDEPPELLVPLETPPPRPLDAIERELGALLGRERELEAALGRDAEQEGPRLRGYLAALDDRLALHRAAAVLEPEGPLWVLRGHCPRDRLPALREALRSQPVVLLEREPAPDEDVPIALRNGPVVQTFEPLVAAFKLPAYRELDPTPLVAPFMGLFFGVCLGDLGYGAVLTAVAWGALAWGRPQGDARRLLRWALLLGACAMAAGLLLGSVFGTRLHHWLPLPADALLFSWVDDPKRLFYASLGFGVVQLQLGLGIRLVRTLAQRRWQAAVGALAWLLVLPALGLALAGLVPWWPAVAVAIGLLLFAAPEPSPLRRLGGGAWALYNVTSLLGAVASYARIFGLGLSSGIIAMVVNTIAATVAAALGGAAGLVVAAVVLVLGHAFNFAMAVIGSVVHPARLQLLEFLDTFFEGGGRPFAPFAVTGWTPGTDEETRR